MELGTYATITQSYSGAMATIKVNVCRFRGNTVLSIALFTKDSLDRDLPGRISRVVDLRRWLVSLSVQTLHEEVTGSGDHGQE